MARKELSQPPFFYPSGSIRKGLKDFKELVENRAPDPRKAGHNFRSFAGDWTAEHLNARYEAEDLIPEITIGVENFLPGAFLEQGGVAASSVGRITVEPTVNYKGEFMPAGWFGTAFLVSDRILLTNHHVLNSLEACRKAILQLGYRRKLDGTPDTHDEYLLRPEELFVTSPYTGGLDYTFVAIDSASDEYRPLKLDRRAYVTQPGSSANIIQHPNGDYQMIAIRENPMAKDNGITLHYFTDTEPGSSGSPVFDNSWRLIGLHHAARKNSDGLQMHGEKPKYVNEAIKLSSIVADLEEQAESEGFSGQATELLKLFSGINSTAGYFGTLGRTSSLDGPEALVDRYRGTEQDVDVGAFNIEWFSNRYTSKLDLVATMVADFNLDIWSLVESSPEAADALVKKLDDDFGLKFKVAHSEPEATTGKQSTSLIWNSRTVKGKRITWPEDIRDWFEVRSRDFQDEMLEAVHGKIFNRYPGLFRFSIIGAEFDFYVVPLHLKAKGEGSLRRRMASKILASAVNKSIEKGMDKDWLIMGDFNAELATSDFAALDSAGLVPLSASDEQNQSLTYLKGRYKSTIDHAYVSPNLAKTFGEEDFYIVAADKQYPDYIRRISDHRPIVVRLKVASNVAEAGSPKVPDSLKTALKELYGSRATT